MEGWNINRNNTWCRIQITNIYQYLFSMYACKCRNIINTSAKPHMNMEIVKTRQFVLFTTEIRKQNNHASYFT